MGNLSLREITTQDYDAAWVKLYAATSGYSSTSPRAAGFMLALLSQTPAQVGLSGIAQSFDNSNLAAVITVLRGYSRHNLPEWIDSQVMTELRAIAARVAA